MEDISRVVVQETTTTPTPTTPPLSSSKNVSPILIANKQKLMIHESLVLSMETPNYPIIDLAAEMKSKQPSEMTSMTSATSTTKPQSAATDDDDEHKDDIMGVKSMQGYVGTPEREALYWLLAVASFGLVFLVFHWFDMAWVKIRYRKTDTLASAHVIVVTGIDNRYEICMVKSSNHLPKHIEFRHSRFFYQHDIDYFERPKVRDYYDITMVVNMVDKGLTMDEYNESLEKYDSNIMNFPVKSIPRLLLEEVLHPFFIFQIYSVCLWMAEEYYYYACAIFLIATVSSILSLREIRHNLVSLKKMSTYDCEVRVLRDSTFKLVSSTSLVPGDIVDISQNMQVPCDLSLLTGSAICNESMLTGESIPVTKHPLLTPDELNHIRQLVKDGKADQADPIDFSQARSSMFGGTIVVKVIAPPGGRILAAVRQTGFQTSKGRLILSILFPKKSHFKFLSESLKFVGVLCAIALVGFSVSVWRLNSLGVDAGTIALRALDLITIVIPPALPMAITVGTGFALIRLRHKKIFCISPPRVNMAGKIQVFCFDKTGTLTEEGLDFYGVLGADSLATFRQRREDFTSNHRILRLIMASCHSLSTINNEVSGDPLELKIYQAVGANLHETDEATSILVPELITNQETIPVGSDPITPPNNNILGQETLVYIERFDFQSSLQRMSVLVTCQQTGERFSLVKGSPEIIRKLSRKETVPHDFEHQLSQYTQHGYRVLGCAYKSWDNVVQTQQNISSREQMRALAESDLIFSGFIIMENKLKPESAGIIKQLHKANIRTIMVTGDNPLTAVSVARQCGILKNDSLSFLAKMDQHHPHHDEKDDDHHHLLLDNMISWDNISNDDSNHSLSYHKLDPSTLLLDAEEGNNAYSLIVTGNVFRKIHQHYLATGSTRFTQMLKKTLVYSRMSPEDKQCLVEELQRVGLYVGMCGDGANDCGALKAAHVGISLSETEASIAAPFTSTVTNISCCPTLIKEGRASLAVSFKLFQFMGMYSLIQFISVIFLYFIASVLGNWMYLYQDLWIIFPLVIFMGMTRPSDKLSVKRPSGRLISGAIVGSLIVHIAVCMAFQSCVFFFVRSQSWYNQDQIDEDNIVTYVTTSLFIYANFQYLIMALSFSFGKPFLKPLYTNRYLFITYLVALISSLLLLFAPQESVWRFGEMLIMPVKWRLTLFGLIISNLAANLIVEFCFVYYKLRSKKKKVFYYDQIFSKDVPFDKRITEETILLQVNSNGK